MAERGANEGVRLLEALFHAHSGVKLLIDPADGRIVDANPAAVRFYGYPRETLLAMHIWQINVASQPTVQHEMTRASMRDANYFEFQHRLANGEVRDVAVNSSPVEVDGRSLLFSIIHDISDRVQAERELRSAQAYQRALFDGLRDAIIVASNDGRILDVNPQAEVLLGRSRAELLAMHHSAIFPEALRPLARDRFATRREGKAMPGGDLVQFEVERPDGQRVPVEIAGRPLSMGDGTEVLLGVFRDVSARHASESELHRLSQIIAQSPAAIMVTDLKGSITWVNEAFTALSGYSLDEVRGQNPRLFKSNETPGDVHAHLWATISKGRTWQGEIVNRRKNGELYREELVISPLRDAHGQATHYVAVKQDVTERHRLEEDLRQAQRLEAVGQLAGGVAHDFNNLLAVQQMNLSLLLRRNDLSPETRELVQELEQGAHLAADVTRKLLAFSRRQSLKQRVVSLDVLVGDLMKLLRRVLPENITAVHQRAEGPTWVSVDAAAAEQAVMNLVVNARDAMPTGGTLTITTAPTDNGRTVTLTVKDTGHGIDPQALPHIFEPFYTRRSNGRGTGLGLATVYGVVKQHGGVVEVDSAPGQGATFRLKFPATAPPADEPNTPPPALNASVRLKVLLVEDSDDVRRALARGLAGLGHEVVEARNAADALAQWPALRDGIDALLTDVVMPGELSGVQLARRLRADRADLFVIVASGYSGDLTKDLEPDFHFLAKPFRFDELGKMLTQVPARNGRVRMVWGPTS